MLRWVSRILYGRTKLTTAEAYELWAASYPPLAHNPLMVLEEKALLEMLPDVSGCRALDAACGSGRYTSVLRQRQAALAVGLDTSASMLAVAKVHFSDLVRADMLSMCFLPGVFDIVICGLALGHMSDLPRALLEVARVLVPGGTVLYSDLHPIGEWLGWKRTFRDRDGRTHEIPHHFHTYSDHVAACAAAGLRIVEVREPCMPLGRKCRRHPAALVVRARKPGAK